MKKYEILFNIINNLITLFFKYYIYLRVFLFLIFIILTKNIKIISIVIYQDIFSNQILKKKFNKKDK